MLATGLISYWQSSVSPVPSTDQKPKVQAVSPVEAVKGSSVDPVVKPDPVAKVQ